MSKTLTLLLVTLVSLALYFTCSCSKNKQDQKEVLSYELNSLASMDFPPGQEVVISNPLIFKVSATCQLSVLDDKDTFISHMIKGSGKLNGQDVSGTIQVDVTNGMSLGVQASALAKVSITNSGNQNVHAECSL